MPESELATSMEHQVRTLLGHSVLWFCAGVWTTLVALCELGSMTGVYVAAFAGWAFLLSAVQHRRSCRIEEVLLAANRDALGISAR